MSKGKGIYYKGLTIECDSSIPRLTIEGREVPENKVTDLLVSSEAPDETTRTRKLRALAETLVDQSRELKSREAAKINHLAILHKGVKPWNEWRRNHPAIRPILYEADLSWKALPKDLRFANFANAVLVEADLSDAQLCGANFHEANLGGAILHGADLTKANFCRTDFYDTDLSGATLTGANLQGTQLAKTCFERATLINCTIYGLSAWDVNVNGAIQKDLTVVYNKENALHNGEPEKSTIIVNDLRSAQFIYLLLHNENIRAAIDTMTAKVVLILGRFSPERKPILDRIREELRDLDYVPIMFDFEKPQSRNLEETVRTLASISKWVIADLTDPRSVLQEVTLVARDFQSVAMLMMREKGNPEYGMLDGILSRPSVVNKIFEYDNSFHLIASIKKRIILPLEKLSKRLLKKAN
jgi:uncharacterized protein YjbI with pentapeptide repeats